MVSIVVPVYNAAKYLEECIASVFSQSFDDWELILVDDGSSDGSGLIIDRMAEADPRVKAIHRANGGMSAARNTGIAAARGEFMYFLDADDVLHPDALKLLFKAFENEGVGMAIGGAVIGKSCRFKKSNGCDFIIMSPEDAIADSLYQKNILHAPWGKIYRRKLMEKVGFTDGLCYEDLDFFYRYCLLCDKVAYTPASLYFYRQHAESVMHVWKPRRLDVLAVVDDIVRYMEQNHPSLAGAARDRKLSANFNIFLLATRYGQADVASRCWEVVKKYRYASLIDSNVRVKNKLGILLSYFGRRFFSAIALR